MSSILLLLEDGEMHPFVPGTSGSHIILTRGGGNDGSGSPPSLTYTVDGDNLTLGSHFLTTDGMEGIKDEEGTVVTKLEVENVPLEVVVERSGQKKKRKHQQGGGGGSSGGGMHLLDTSGGSGNGSLTERKVCLWPTGSGTTCGKTFTKFDSLKRHLSEAHKGLRPFACTLCDKTYGRRDYLQRHLKSHNNSYAVNLAGGGGGGGGSSSGGGGGHGHSHGGGAHVISHVVTSKKAQQHHHHQQQHQQHQSIVLVQQQPQQQNLGNSVQIIQQQQSHHHHQSSSGGHHTNQSSSSNVHAPNNLPFFSLSGQLPTAKPMGSKICRWVQNDGTVCGKAFSKLDSLRRHVNELHKGVRPYACNLCEKSYGRRDYLDRHLRTHARKAAKAEAEQVSQSTTHAVVSADGAIDWGPNSGVLMSGDELPTPPAVTTPKVPKKKRKDIPPEEKKICLWILEDGTACGKTFTKFDSLKRHVSEAHKQIRPYTCSLCGKNYGRRDYLLRHLRSHNDIEISNIHIQKIPNNPSNHPANNLHNLNTSSSSTASSTSSTSGLPSINFSQMLPPHPPTQVLAGIVPSSSHHQHHNQQQQQQHHHQQQQQQQHHQSSTGTTTIRIAPAATGGSKKKSLEEKKTCKWVLDNGTVCGKTFSKFDSLRRHVAELHKNIRPFVCELCQKSYGRKDYLDRHMRSHMVEGGDGSGGMGGGSLGGDEDDDDEDEEMVGRRGGGGRGGNARGMKGGRGGGNSGGGTIIATDSVIDADDIETTTTTVVVDTGDPDEEVILPSVVTVVSNDDV